MIVEALSEPMTERAAAVWRVLEDVPDPEIPALSIVDIGIVRYVRWDAQDTLHVGLTPTYTGCPATEVIRGSVRRALVRAGHEDAQVDTVLSPPWTSDWLTREGRQKLAAFGIAPPAEPVSSPRRLFGGRSTCRRSISVLVQPRHQRRSVARSRHRLRVAEFPPGR